MLSPAGRRRVVERVVERLQVSERRACRVLGQHRSAQRYETRQSDLSQAVIERTIALACDYGRYGYRRITERSVVRAGWSTTRGLRGSGGKRVSRFPSGNRNGGGCGLTTSKLALSDCSSTRICPTFPLRQRYRVHCCDREGLAEGTGCADIVHRARKPQDENYSESFRGRLRDELLNVHLFWTTDDAREKLEA